MIYAWIVYVSACLGLGATLVLAVRHVLNIRGRTRRASLVEPTTPLPVPSAFTYTERYLADLYGVHPATIAKIAKESPER